MHEKENLLPLTELSKELERRGHGAKSRDRLRIYADRGVKVFPDAEPIKLECWKINGRRSSSVAAYERFIREQIAAQEVRPNSDALA